jgi:micrococcal nuclease
MQIKRWILLILLLAASLSCYFTLGAPSVASTLSSCPGDVNGDGVVNLFDLVAVSMRYGALAILHEPEDRNGDGSVNLLDLVFVAADYGCVATLPTSTPSTKASAQFAYVPYVYDGDTIAVQIGGAVYRVRYIGMNTPEMPHECYAREATNKNSEWVLHKTVRLEKDVRETDHLGRLLRYVYVGDVFVNAELVRLGYAQVYTVPPDVKYASYFLQLQQEARDAGRGLWSGCVTSPSPSPPSPCPAAQYYPASLCEGCPSYIASSRRDPFHHPWCYWAQQISPTNLECFYTRQEALSAGHRPCMKCNP